MLWVLSLVAPSLPVRTSVQLALTFFGCAGGLISLLILLVTEGHRLLRVNAAEFVNELKTEVARLQRVSREVESLCEPVLQGCQALLNVIPSPPVFQRYESRLRLYHIEQVELPGDRKMRIAHISRSIRYDVTPPKPCPGPDLFLPILVGTDELYLNRDLWQKLQKSRLDCHFPVSRGWARGVDGKVAEVLKTFEWIREPRLEIDGHKYPLKPEIGEGPVRALVQSVEGLQDPEHGLGEVIGECFSVVQAFRKDQPPHGGSGRSVRVRYWDTYCVAIEVPGTSSVMFRYNMPFAFPAYVSELAFELGNSPRKEFELLPPIVATAVNPDEHQEDDPLRRRRLTWRKQGAPFIPGNAVVFLWHRPLGTG